jgi:hypothetical protein
MSHLNMEKKIMHEEHKEEINRLKASIKHYQDELKKPAWKYTFGKEDSHDIAKRIISRDKEELKKLESYYE